MIKVLIVDDSALIRALLKEIFQSDSRLQVVAVAKDAFEARDLIKQTNPDVITLDIEMPKMNGISFLRNLMRLRPMPVVMISTLTQEGAPATLEALELGAVDFVAKPRIEDNASLENYRQIIIEKVISASKARISENSALNATDKASNCKKNALYVKNKSLKANFICAIGASTGGTEAIKEVVSSLPPMCPPVVVVQHIPEAFSHSYAARINSVSEVTVCEASDNQKLEPGNVYIAPGHSHLRVVSFGGAYFCKLDAGDPVNRHRPSVDVLFDSVIETVGRKAVGVLLTGMGVDGAEGLLRMKQKGCFTIAQDAETSIVWGMPGAAVKLGAAEKVLPLDKITSSILSTSFV